MLNTNAIKLDQCGKMRCKYCESCSMKSDLESAERRDQNRIRELRIEEEKLDALEYVDSKNYKLPCKIRYDLHEAVVNENKSTKFKVLDQDFLSVSFYRNLYKFYKNEWL